MLTYITTFDNHLFWLINAHHTAFFDYFFSLITNLGNGWVVTPILLAIILRKIPRSKVAAFIIFSILAMTSCGLLNSQIKKSVDRPRPPMYFAVHPGAPLNEAIISHHTTAVHIVGKKLMQHSFPSGHANTAFAAATLLVLGFGAMYWPTYVFAFLVGYSRIYMGVHFPTDVATGALLGIAVIWISFTMFTKLPFSRNRHRDQQKKINRRTSGI